MFHQRAFRSARRDRDASMSPSVQRIQNGARLACVVLFFHRYGPFPARRISRAYARREKNKTGERKTNPFASGLDSRQTGGKGLSRSVDPALTIGSIFFSHRRFPRISLAVFFDPRDSLLVPSISRTVPLTGLCFSSETEIWHFFDAVIDLAPKSEGALCTD